VAVIAEQMSESRGPLHTFMLLVELMNLTFEIESDATGCQMSNSLH
jgi:hypothetical protein